MGLLLSGMVRVKSAEVEEREFEGKKGKFVERVQYAFVEVGEETRKIRLRIEKGQPAYQPGMYELHTECRVGQYGDVSIPYVLTLRPVRASAPGAKVG